MLTSNLPSLGNWWKDVVRGGGELSLSGPVGIYFILM